MAFASLSQDALTQSEGTHMNVALWLVTSLSTIFLALRLYCKRVPGRQRLSWDDYVLIASWAFLLVAVIMNTVNIARGFGKHIFVLDINVLTSILFLTYPTETFTTLANVLSKTSFALTLLPLLKSRYRVFVWFLIISTHIVLDLSVFFLWTHCTPVDSLWNPVTASYCWKPMAIYGYRMFATSYSALMDLVLTLLAWRVLWTLKLNRAEKLGALTTTALGLFAVAAAVVKTTSLSTLMSSVDQLYDSSRSVIWGIAEVAMTIVAVSIPALRIFFVRGANRKSSTGSGPYSNDGIEVCGGRQVERGELEDTGIPNRAPNSITGQMNEVNEIDAVDTSRAPPLAELAQPAPVESGQQLHHSTSEFENLHIRPTNTTEMDQIHQPQILVPELPGPPATVPAELPDEGPVALGLHYSQQQSSAPPSLPTPATETNVAELLRSQAQLQERRRRLLELQQIDEQEEVIRQQLMQIQSGQAK